MRFRATIQGFFLSVFLFLLAGAIIGFLPSADLFLRMDPSIALLVSLAGKNSPWAFIPAFAILVMTPFVGRIFCGYICPMGTLIDLADSRLGSRSRIDEQRNSLRKLKYLILFFLAGSALFGVSLVFFGSPLSLVTRFFGLLIYPVISLAGNTSLVFLRPLAERIDLRSLMFLEIDPPRFSTQFFILLFFAFIFLSGKISRRFWCRNLCPSGAIFSLLSQKPIVLRHVGSECTSCGKCVRACPMSAVQEKNPKNTRFRECLACGGCVRACPEKAIDFRVKNISVGNDVKTAAPEKPISRRQFVYSGLSGAGSAILFHTGLDTVFGTSEKGFLQAPGLIRPPGSLPEPDFLARCVRCGECIAACPTNTLQPLWFRAGFIGIFSPAITPLRKYCDPRCLVCGSVCPTGAIRKLDAFNRIWAKTGTAVISRQKCLAWEHQKSCMVCDEVCPFDAISFKKEPGNPVAVPRVRENRCAGCGYCEHSCPVQNRPAIVVTAMGAIRMKDGAYYLEGKKRGLFLRLRKNHGFSDRERPGEYGFESPSEQDGQIAPGFDSGE